MKSKFKLTDKLFLRKNLRKTLSFVLLVLFTLNFMLLSYFSLVNARVSIDAPILDYPSNNDLINDNTPIFVWQVVSQATGYQLELDSSPAFKDSQIITLGIQTSFPVPSNQPLPDGEVYWHVRAKDQIGLYGDWSTTWMVEIDTTPPSTPILVAPVNLLITTDNTPIFDWNYVSGANYYNLQVSIYSDFSILEVNYYSSASSYSCSALADDRWYWRVRSRDDAENWGSFSNYWYFDIDTTGPAIPTLHSPSNGYYSCYNYLDVTWLSVAGASQYQLQVDTTSSFSSPEVNIYTEQTSKHLLSLEETKNYWRVRSLDSLGNPSGWSNIWNFICLFTPPQPSLINPVFNHITNDQTPYFEWSNEPTQLYSDILVSRSDSEFTTIYWQQAVYLSNHFTVSSDDAFSQGIYYWKVRIRNQAGVGGPYSSIFRFTIDLTPPSNPPSLLAPLSGSPVADNTPTISWDTNIDYYQYHVQVSSDSDFITTVVDLVDYGGTSLTTSVLFDGNWYWRVKACDRAGNYGEWSDIWVFKIDTVPPSVPELEAPLDESLLGFNSIELRWSSISGIEGYYLQVDTSATFSNPLVNNYITENQYTMIFDENTYYWRVRAIDAAGNNGSWSSYWCFIVDTTPPEVNIDSPIATVFDTHSIVIDLSGDAENYWYYIENVDLINQTWNEPEIRILPDGTFTLHVYGNDLAGIEIHVSKVFTIDTVGPNIIINSPSTLYCTYEQVLIDFSGDASYYWYYIEGLDDQNQTWTLPQTRTLTEGSYSIHVFGNDTVGNEAYLTFNFNIDITPPIVSILHPMNISYESNNILLAFEGNAEYYCYYIVNLDQENQTWDFDVTRFLEDGTYLLIAYGEDLAGLITSKFVYFSIDTSSTTSTTISTTTSNIFSDSSSDISSSGTDTSEKNTNVQYTPSFMLPLFLISILTHILFKKSKRGLK